MKIRALVLLSYGTNRDNDVAEALSLVGADSDIIPLNTLREDRKRWANYQMLVLPGGFSYADALGAGKLLALDINSYFVDEIYEFVDTGKPVIGICNGFQALIKSGLLPGSLGNAKNRAVKTKNSNVTKEIDPHSLIASIDQSDATLTFNSSGHFECRWIVLKPISQTCIWTKNLDQLIECPVAHGEGNFQVSDQSLLDTLKSLDQLALTYVRQDGSPANNDYPANPNGSLYDIAGVTNPRGNILGLMPHPENHIQPWQHPQWTRGVNKNSGLPLFKNGVKYVQEVS